MVVQMTQIRQRLRDQLGKLGSDPGPSDPGARSCFQPVPRAAAAVTVTECMPDLFQALAVRMTSLVTQALGAESNDESMRASQLAACYLACGQSYSSVHFRSSLLQDLR